MNSINYIPHSSIDMNKWDMALLNSTNARIYATSWYLNSMCEQWDALIVGDYEYIMPLPVRKKYGIEYVFVPAFIQQLGIFSNLSINQKIIKTFIQAIPKKIKYCDIILNSGNKFTEDHSIQRKNYLLRLSYSYESLQKQYSRMANRNIKTAIAEGIFCEKVSSPSTTLLLHRKRFNDSIGPSDEDYKKLEQLLLYATKTNHAVSVVAKRGQDVIASSTYLLFGNRIIFLLNGNTAASLDVGATHLLKDFVLREYANTNLIMDFEGSDYASFARFYEQFGAKEIEYYPQLIINRLPLFMRWIKKRKSNGIQ